MATSLHSSAKPTSATNVDHNKGSGRDVYDIRSSKRGAGNLQQANQKDVSIVRLTDTQKHFLVDFMEAHPRFVPGRILRQEADWKLWSDLVCMLNNGCQGGSIKTDKQWRRTWKDIMRDTRTRVKQQQQSSAGECLSALHQRILKLMKDQRIGHANTVLEANWEDESTSKDQTLRQAIRDESDDQRSLISFDMFDINPSQDQKNQSLNGDDATTMIGPENMKVEAEQPSNELEVEINQFNMLKTAAINRLAAAQEDLVRLGDARLLVEEKRLLIEERKAKAMETLAAALNAKILP